MALLQISEPGMSAAPHQHRLAVGIDLGTTNTLVATSAAAAQSACLIQTAAPPYLQLSVIWMAKLKSAKTPFLPKKPIR